MSTYKSTIIEQLYSKQFTELEQNLKAEFDSTLLAMNFGINQLPDKYIAIKNEFEFNLETFRSNFGKDILR